MFVCGKCCPVTCQVGSGVRWRYSFTLSLTSALEGGGWSALLPGRFTPGKKIRYRRLGGPRERVRYIPPPSVFELRTCPANSIESLYRLRYPGRLFVWYVLNLFPQRESWDCGPAGLTSGNPICSMSFHRQPWREKVAVFTDMMTPHTTGQPCILFHIFITEVEAFGATLGVQGESHCKRIYLQGFNDCSYWTLPVLERVHPGPQGYAAGSTRPRVRVVARCQYHRQVY
jgi:hypothetical protein